MAFSGFYLLAETEMNNPAFESNGSDQEPIPCNNFTLVVYKWHIFIYVGKSTALHIRSTTSSDN
jgi:hypothetical protein